MQSNLNQRFRADVFSQGPNYSAGCRGVGRITNIRSNSSRLKSQENAHRASSASSLYRSRNYSQSNEGVSCLPGGWNGTAVYSRPGSAKLWVERCTQKREQEERKKQQLEVANKQFQAAQFRANFFNARPSAPRCYTVEDAAISTKDEQDSFAECGKPENIHEHSPPKSLRSCDPKDENTNTHGLFDHKSYRTILGPSELVKPEIATLKRHLEELRQKNADERQKLNEELRHQAWQKSSVEARKLESNRLNEFVRSAWVDQRQWREDERKRRELEDLRIEQEAEILRREQEEKEHKEAEERQRKREEYQRDLEGQLEVMRRQEQQRLELARAADHLVAERDRLLELADRRQQLLQTRRARAIAVSWSRQYHIKLRQRAAQVLQEILEDQQIIREVQHQQHSSLMGLSPNAGAAASGSFKNSHTRTNAKDDLSLVLNILEEHRKLEELRQNEYDLLFSEEAARLWRCREEQWEREERARENLLKEVLEGRLRQVQERSEARAAAEREVEDALIEVKKRVEEVDANILSLENGVIGNRSSGANGDIKESGGTELQEEESEEQMRKNSKEEEEPHRKEIARLEVEMARLWGPLYTPPHYGRKKVQW